MLLTCGLPATKPATGGMRRLDNIILANGIFLDNDGGDLSPQEFAEFFPSLELVIFNTYSSTPEKPRWRVYIPTECVMTKYIYRNIIEHIFSALESNGFDKDGDSGNRKHGFDKGKKNASDPMYLPCQAAHPRGSFFLEFREAPRSPLDPRSWINFDHEPESFIDLVQRSRPYEHYKPLPEVEIEQELFRWRVEGDRPHNRNVGWSALYFALLAKGVPGAKIEEIMTEEAGKCASIRLRNDRIKQLVRLRKRAGH